MQLLDTTIRDGSYAINYNFSCVDVDTICKRLEALGFSYIEVGHGMGLHASSEKNGISLHTDEEYMLAARHALRSAKFGVFCIPGVARIEDLKLAADCGASFVRIGCNADAVKTSQPYVEEAKRLGLMVAANYMKSYVITPEQFAQNVLMSESFGADFVYIVDSAGGMFPEDIYRYYNAVRAASKIPLGFHAHDNLGLAASNSAYCAELGFDWIDCSLQGLGRSSGNAATELLIPILKRRGFDLDFDLVELISAGYELLSPLTERKMLNPLDVICGYAGFHTSYMKYISRAAGAYRVNPLLLIMAYCEYDKVNMDYDKLCEIAAKLPKDTGAHRYNFSGYIGSEQGIRSRSPIL